MASRAQLMCELIIPALEQGMVVLCDRFVSATIAYQGASGVDVETIIRLAEIAIDQKWPDVTLILDLPVEEGFGRLGIDRQRLKRPQDEERQKMKAKSKAVAGQLSLFGDRMESRSMNYHEKVVAIFKELHTCYPTKVRHINAVGTEEDVFSRMADAIADEFSA